MNKFKRFCCIASTFFIVSSFASCALKEQLPEDTPKEIMDIISNIEDNLSSADISNTSSDILSSDASSDISDISSPSSAPEDVSSDTSDTHVHSFTETVIIEPTCTENGEKEIACECGYSEQEEISATGHKESWVVVKNATETEEGLEKAVCEVCGEEIGKERTIPKIPASHTCTFVKGETTAPTCTEKGYTLYSCSCGKSEKRDYVSALGHLAGDWETVKEATTSSTGLKQIKCSRCGTVLEEEIIDNLPSDEDKYNVPATAENAKLVEERVLYYLNQYRISEGTPEATFLWEGKTYKYAKARAEQLVTNFSHDTEDIRKVCTELEFGYYHPTVEYFYDDEGNLLNVIERDEAYYSGGCSEAITGPYGSYSSVDVLARKVASAIYSSKTHWSYVGAETTKHVTVGCYVDVWGDFSQWYFCIATSSSDQYD